MARIVILQFGMTVIVVIIATTFGGFVSGFSALLGGLSCAVPTGLFAARLYVSAKKPDGPTAANFFIGEFFKIASTLALMLASVYLYQDLDWLAFVAATILVLKSYFILLFRH